MDTISPYYIKPTHGNAFKSVMEQRRLMDAFITMMKNKLELDNHHLKSMVELRQSWDPRWQESEIGSLLSPMLTYLDNEILHREHAHDELSRLWAKFSPLPSLNSPEGDLDFSEMPSRLEGLFNKCQKSHETVCTPDGKEQLQSWYKQRLAAQNETRIKIPPIDRAYREAVIAQQQYVKKVNYWYDNDLEVIIEGHQQYAEDTKKLLNVSLCALSELAARLAASCSSAIQSISDFASIQFISDRHEERTQEKEHVLLRPFDYRAYYRNDEGELSTPLFGLGKKKTVEIAQQILDTNRVKWQMWHATKEWRDYHCGLKHMFQLERRLLQTGGLKTLVEEEYRDWPGHVLLYLQYALWSEQPLIEIPSLQIFEYTRYTDDTSRRMLGSITQLDSAEPATSHFILSLLTGAVKAGDWNRTAPYISSLLTHNESAAEILTAVYQKWDWDSTPNRPLSPLFQREVRLLPTTTSFPRYIDLRYCIGVTAMEESHSAIISGVDKVTDALITVKLAPKQPKPSQMPKYHSFQATLSTEHRLYERHVNTDGLPRVWYYGSHEGRNCLVTDRLGPDLEHLLQKNGGTFSLKTVAMCAIQMITRLDAFHSQNGIHLGIGLHNFAVGLKGNERSKIYLTNLGHCLTQSVKVPPHVLKYNTRTRGPRFTKRDPYLQGFLDQLGLLGYLLVYFLRGHLPWGDGPKDNIYESIAAANQTLSVQEICEGCPAEFSLYLRYLREIPIHEPKVDCYYLCELFQRVLTDIGESDDGVFDWTERGDDA